MDFLKASILISTGCSVVVTAVSAYSLKQQAELNRILAQGAAQMQADSAEIKTLLHSVAS